MLVISVLHSPCFVSLRRYLAVLLACSSRPLGPNSDRPSPHTHVRPTHHHYHYPAPASASRRLLHTSLIAMQSDQLSGNEACAALLRRSAQGYRRDLCEPQGAAHGHEPGPPPNPLTLSASSTECQRASQQPAFLVAFLWHSVPL